ncbi:hypothetical protein BU23DRAFT_558910 [Bimuria novae-zelandiae CBS 107.79]|uniref:Rhodopsin domain-containing protein n=1 Tax=Bimuria novae-zelandiae CBS 107.79 TaxID=1447943 RepID=A0A6A5UT95_9PLEO|nr:hypothetical protein BU23DRAFT_558910 [Bimuria novae-zelandiae CBS 107.79]
MTAEREKALSEPAAHPPLGVTPDFEHPSQFEKSGLVAAITLLIVISLLFSMRMFVKARIARHIDIEDYLLALAWTLYSGGFTLVAIMVTRKHVGAHQWNLTLGQLIDYLKTFHTGSLLYNVIILPLKVSIILQLLRFFAPHSIRNSTLWMFHTVIWLNVIFYVTCTFLLIFACKPDESSSSSSSID